MSKRIVAAAAALMLLCAADAPPGGFDAAAAFGARERLQDMSLSPDGTKVAFIRPTEGQGGAVVTIGLAPGSKPSIAAVAPGEPERLGGCRWVSNDRLVCTAWGVVSTAMGVLRLSRVFAVDADGKNMRILSRRENTYSQGFALGGGEVIDWLPNDDGYVLMSRVQVADDHLGTRLVSTKTGVTVDRLDTRTMAANRVETPRDDAISYLSDGQGNVRIMGVQRVKSSGMQTGVIGYYYRLQGSREWKELSSYDYVHRVGFDPYAVDSDRNAVYGFKMVEGRKAIARLALDGTMKEEILYARPDVDVDDIVQIGRRSRVVGASFATDKRQVVYFEPDIARLAASLSKALPNQPLIYVVDASADGNRLLILAGSDNDPGVYYVYDRVTKELSTFQPVRPELEGVVLAKVKPVTYPAADGTMIPAYLTLPPGKETATGLPAIVIPHGGPEARDEWGFDWLSQYFANQGFAVLQPNFRGSSGYGEDWFKVNGFRSWRIAIGDVLDAGRWLISSKVADPKKLVIFGASYGGYAALQSAVVDPSLFKAVVAWAPVTDLALLTTESRGWSDYDVMRDYIGVGPHVFEGSPAQNAARIKAPVLMFHGELDRNVEVAESRLMDSKLTAAGVPHELVTYPKLDHYLQDSAARTDMLRKSDAFIRKAIGM